MSDKYLEGVQIRKKVYDFIVSAVLITVLALVGAVILLEWAVGCGETWVQADGSHVTGECVIIGRFVK